MYKYLFWDLDDTILNFEAAERQTILTLFERFHLGKCSDERIALYSKINQKYWQALERKEMTKKEILVNRFVEFFETIGVDSSISEEFNAQYQVTLGDTIVFIDGAMEMLQAEKGKYQLVCITNGTKIAQTKKFRNSKLDQVFDAIFISEDVGYEKPSTEYFDFIFNQLKITNRSEVLIIGDSLTSDMKGGVNAHVDTCWYNPKHITRGMMNVTYEIDSLSQLKDILQ